MNGRMEAERMAAEHEKQNPLPGLTSDERSLLEMLADHPRTHEIMPNEVAILRGLLARSATSTRE